MSHSENVKWMEDKIAEFQNSEKESGKQDAKILGNILYTYKYNYEKANELSWVKNPDRMGQ